ncbi:MAG: thiamine-phosphate kinase [Rhodoferax sp.]|uniref:thiamine-phosphate kinase n=1 Tax=Rhodoferax sp. TaxID=50421 RepID=UPI00271BF385|nr:thiamine-phosphate kinase [Rhodoferax sp.]MDO8449347.1 thiamine-phosphate kinase [Rhodoferax sp.]
MGEFDLIERYFKRPARQAVLGVGDDCAILQPAPGTQLAISCDMLVEGRHFFPSVDPRALGHKALAVNLSDLAACGARPLAFTLALALPRADDAWLAPFSQGLLALADAHGCELVGGDTTQGPLNICITVFGEVPVLDGRSQALLRSGAQPGDDLYVSGTLGDAGLALEVLRGAVSVPAPVLDAARLRLESPAPRVALGLALRGIATAAIDVSDGLLGDLGHILKQSGVGATVDVDVAIKLIAARAYYSGAGGRFDTEPGRNQWLAWALAGGDDYELLFTAPASAREAVAAAGRTSQTPVTRIGHIDPARGLRLVDGQGQAVANTYTSFDHFA